MSSDIIRVSPESVRDKLEDVSDLQAPIWPGDWDVTRRIPLHATAKHRAIVEHFVEGRPWITTALFREIYPVRFAAGEYINGCRTLEALAAQYAERVDALFASLKARGFLACVDGAPVPLPKAYLARDGSVILGNQGNHRVAMAKVLGLPSILLRVVTRHPLTPASAPPPVLDPVLPPGADAIPAMTTPAERMALYRMARAQAPMGAIVELGVWLGAVTVYLAAAVRDAGRSRVVSYDRFIWKPVHTIKAGGMPTQPVIDQVRQNVGALATYVTLRAGDFRHATWTGEPIGALILDGPKRVHEITRTLPIFGGALQAGARIAFQDFAHFPSYELVTVLERLEAVDALRFEHGIYPGTTVITEVQRPIQAEDVSAEALRLDRWEPARIAEVWARWAARLPEGQRPRFRCGEALFLCDRDYTEAGTARWRALLDAHPEEILPKWHMLRATDNRTITQYPTLDAVIPR